MMMMMKILLEETDEVTQLKLIVSGYRTKIQETVTECCFSRIENTQ